MMIEDFRSTSIRTIRRECWHSVTASSLSSSRCSCLSSMSPTSPAARPSGKHCVRSGPRFVAFIISFIVLAIAWAGHRDLFSLIQRTDRALVWFNIAYLLPLSILPFGASLIASYDRDPIALRMFGILLVAGTATRLGIWVYATGRSYLLFKPVDVRTRWVGVAIAGVPGIAYAIAIAIAEEAPTASLAIYAAGPVLYFITIWLARSSAPPGSEEHGFT